MRTWANITRFLLLGYLLLGRSFAYLGIPPAKVFIGEIALGAFLLFRPKQSWLRLLHWFVTGRALAWAFIIFLIYGLAEAIRGIFFLDHPALIALQNLVFNVYPLYLLLGIWVGMRNPLLLRKLIRTLAVLNGIYGPLYILWLNRLELVIPGTAVPVFGQPGGSALALLGVLAFEPKPLHWWPWLVLNAFVLLGVQVRAEWLAFAVGLLVWVRLSRNRLRLVSWGTGIAALVLGMYFLGLRFPSPRGGEISVRGVVARAVAPISPDLAYKMIGEKAYSFAGTMTGWRLPWWQSIWQEVHEKTTTAILGLGYGYPLWDLVEFVPQGVRTPHNVFFYALGYGGILGVILFFGFQAVLAFNLYRARRATSNPFGLMVWASGLALALFGNFFETPFGATPFYLLCGLIIGGRYSHAYLTTPQSLSTTQRRRRRLPDRSSVAAGERT